jgi:hypothetical protein
MALEGYDLKKELGETNLALAIKYGGKTMGGRSGRNWSTATDKRRQADQAYHGTRRAAIRQLLSRFKDEPEEIDLATLPLGVMKDSSGGVQKVCWQGLRKRYMAVDLSEIIKDDETDLNVNQPNETDLTDEQLMQLMIEISAIEY